MNALRIEKLSFSYRKTPVLADVSLSVAPREIVAVLGPNGAGKTTLIKCVNKILRARTGKIFLGEDEIRSLSPRDVARRVGYVSQNQEGARITAFDAVLLGRLPHLKFGVSRRDILKTAGMIGKLGLEELSLRRTDMMSGGELQKVAIARALVQEPDLLVMDEPTSNLDLKNQVEIMRLIRAIADAHEVSALMSLHDINAAIHYADRLVFLKRGRFVAVCDKTGITRELIADVYGIDVIVHQTQDYPVVVPAHY